MEKVDYESIFVAVWLQYFQNEYACYAIQHFQLLLMQRTHVLLQYHRMSQMMLTIWNSLLKIHDGSNASHIDAISVSQNVNVMAHHSLLFITPLSQHNCHS